MVAKKLLLWLIRQGQNINKHFLHTLHNGFLHSQVTFSSFLPCHNQNIYIQAEIYMEKNEAEGVIIAAGASQVVWMNNASICWVHQGFHL